MQSRADWIDILQPAAKTIIIERRSSVFNRSLFSELEYRSLTSFQRHTERRYVCANLSRDDSFIVLYYNKSQGRS